MNSVEEKGNGNNSITNISYKEGWQVTTLLRRNPWSSKYNPFSVFKVWNICFVSWVTYSILIPVAGGGASLSLLLPVASGGASLRKIKFLSNNVI